MALGNAIQNVLALQPAYSSANTPEMQQRGVIVRRTIPSEISKIRTELAKAVGIDQPDLLIEGRDGTGLKSEVPWVRFASLQASPSATMGWYVVWLHRGDGTGAYLTLAHGSTTFKAGALIARPPEELARLMTWSRDALADELERHPALVQTVQLKTKGPLAAAYERSCAVAFFYAPADLTDDSTLRRDMLVMAHLLGRVYEADRLGITPISDNPEVRDAEAAAVAISRPTTESGIQGFALTASERRAVELRAMEVATAHFEALGYSVKDVSAKQSFDLLATRGEEFMHVEVKGSTGAISSVLLTANEVAHHQTVHPNNALALIHSIALDKGPGSPVASGGTLKIWQPWLVENDRLRSISFTYQLS